MVTPCSWYVHIPAASSGTTFPALPAAPPVTSSDRREVTFSDPVSSFRGEDETYKPYKCEGITNLSQIYHPQVQLRLIAQTLKLPAPQKELTGFCSTLIDDI